MTQNSINSNCCPLCSCKVSDLFFQDKNRKYLRCSSCELVFVPRSYRLNSTDEKSIYDLHQNSPHDREYRKFLSRLTNPLLNRLDSKQKGLDFGCGPGPALSYIIEEEGHQVDLYDLFYHDEPSVFSKSYDFICATEVVEHLQNPGSTFASLFQMLRPNGWLGIMTKMVIDEQTFKNWHYIRDLTHICFYNHFSFEYIAQCHNAKVTFIANDVILFNKI